MELQELARYQRWADAEHWKTFRVHPALLEDDEIRKRLSHMVTASDMLCALARGETPDRAALQSTLAGGELEGAMQKAGETLQRTLSAVDPDSIVSLPRGPQGPFEAPSGALLLQALMHSQHHRGQNASRMRQLGITPPMTDWIIWYALGRP